MLSYIRQSPKMHMRSIEQNWKLSVFMQTVRVGVTFGTEGGSIL